MSGTDEKSPVLERREPPLGWILLNRPEVRNALDLRTWRQLAQSFASLEADPQIRVIIIRGVTAEAFVAGADISEFPRLRSNPEQAREYEKAPGRVVEALIRSAKPVIAMISGFCLGGGVQLALACDVKFAARKTRFGIPAARLGLAYPPQAVRMLVTTVGAAHARDILLSGRQFDADEALAMGLINRVFEPEVLEAETRNYALALARNAPLSIAAAKAAVAYACGLEGAADAAEVENMMWRSFDSQDYQEGVRAFLEKRAPNFVGK